MDKYKYSPLDLQDQQFRVLQLYRSDDSTSIIRGSIRIRDVREDAGSYVALSYVWGKDDSVVLIEVDGCPFHIQRNVHDFLSTLRSLMEPKSESMYIFVDAICINQEDLIERSHQVSIMGVIYGCALAVNVWLGSISEEIHAAVQFLKYWSRIEIEEGIQDTEQLIKIYPKALDADSWEALLSLLRNEWWHRMWTYQEYIRARSVLFRSGGGSFSEDELFSIFASLAKAIKFSDLDHKLWLKLGPIFQSSCARRYLNKLDYHGDSILRSKCPLGMLYLHQETHDYVSGDPRDKLYALIGASNDERVIITPDYQKSCKDVYIDFATKCIISTDSLDVLDHAGVGILSSAVSLGQPSWVPDFRHSAAWPAPLGLQFEETKFRADLALSTELQCSVDGATLNCIGYILDTLEHTTGMKGYDDLAWLDKHILGSQNAECMGIPRIQAFFRTIILDTSHSVPETVLVQPDNEFYEAALAFIYHYGLARYHGILADSTKAKALQDRWHDWKAAGTVSEYAMLFTTLIHGIGPSDLISDKSMMEPFLQGQGSDSYLHWPFEDLREFRRSNAESEFVDTTQVNVQHRACFDTVRGFMGLGPEDAVPGDKLCILKGSKFPVLLRPVHSSQHYQLVGTCYVYGLMYGEPVQGQDQSTFHLQSFPIR